MKQGRRDFLRNGLFSAAAVAAGVMPVARAMAQISAQTGPCDPLMQRALTAFQVHQNAITKRRVMAIVDFTQSSATPRFHLLNVEDGNSNALLVAHGKGSDPDHSGWVQSFSNTPGSNATSDGAYMVGESYIGKYGLSRRLIGLDPENDQAEPRAIVIHPAWYVSEELARDTGKIGRSQGCFAFADKDITQVLWQLPTGSLIYAGKI